MQLKAIIIDDEKAARNVLSNLLNLAHSNVEVLEACSNLPEAVISIRKHKPDVVFLDVEMPQFSGYEIVKFFDEIDFQIVFVTAYDKYAVKAFEMNAADYLVKPIQRVRLKASIDRVMERCTTKSQLVNYHSVLEQMEQQNSSTLTISESGQKMILRTTQIIAIQAQGSYCEIMLESGEKRLVSKHIGWMERELEQEMNLFRSHKSWIVNLKSIVAIQSSKELLVLENGIQAKLSRFKKEGFRKALEASQQR